MRVSPRVRKGSRSSPALRRKAGEGGRRQAVEGAAAAQVFEKESDTITLKTAGV
jgi:hypothetical protein